MHVRGGVVGKGIGVKFTRSRRYPCLTQLKMILVDGGFAKLYEMVNNLRDTN